MCLRKKTFTCVHLETNNGADMFFLNMSFKSFQFNGIQHRTRMKNVSSYINVKPKQINLKRNKNRIQTVSIFAMYLDSKLLSIMQTRFCTSPVFQYPHKTSSFSHAQKCAITPHWVGGHIERHRLYLNLIG